MKKKVLMSLVLLAIAGIVFAQTPLSPHKFRYNLLGAGGDMARYEVRALNNSIDGVVSIAGVYQQRLITDVAAGGFQNVTGIDYVYIAVTAWGIGQNAFRGCTGLERVVIDRAMVLTIGANAFAGCTNLVSVTFQTAGLGGNISASAFPGDLRAKYIAGGSGTYTRRAGSNTWTKESGAFCLSCGHPLP